MSKHGHKKGGGEQNFGALQSAMARMENKLDAIVEKLGIVIEKEDSIMATFADLDTALAATEKAVSDLVTRESGEDQAAAAEIATLQAQVADLTTKLNAATAAGSVDTQPLIDRINTLNTTIAGLENAPATTPVAPTPAP